MVGKRAEVEQRNGLRDRACGGVLIFHLQEMKDKEYKKKTLRPLTLAFLEQLQIHLRDLLE